MSAAPLLVAAVLAAAAALAYLFRGDAARRLIRARLGPYRFVFNKVDASKPLRRSTPAPVAVIGGGLAGIAAASALGQRGYAVTLFEAQPYLGGKLGSWPVELGGGSGTEQVSHGYHAFFRHYYNLNRFLDALGVRQKFTAISDYRILLPGGAEISFDSRETTPVLNLLAMAKSGLYRFAEVLRAPTRDAMGVFLEYHPEKTFADLDHLSLAEFDRRAHLPPRLKMAFNTFARAFFATEDKLSMAALVKGFHSYYLGHDGGLVYDHPTRDYEAALLKPIRDHLAANGVALKLGARVKQLRREGGSGTFFVDDEPFQSVVLASDVVGTRALIDGAKGLESADPRLKALEPGQRYAVLRVWLDRAPRSTLPVFVITERHHLLDAISFVDRSEEESRAWVREHQGSVIELHSYAIDDAVPDAQVEGALLAELEKFLPELQGAVVRHRYFAMRRDFAAFHVGKAGQQPGVDTGVEGLYCAGDWVALPFPAMLMEAAFSSGLCAANRILARDGLREEPLESVPLHGLLAGIPQSPARKRLLAR